MKSVCLEENDSLYAPLPIIKIEQKQMVNAYIKLASYFFINLSYNLTFP